MVKLNCPACKKFRPLTAFLPYQADKRLVVDFCAECVTRTPLLTLYETHKFLATPTIVKGIKKQEKQVEKEHKAAVADKVEAVEGKAEVNRYLQELASRELRRKRLIMFTQFFMPEYFPGWVHHDIASRLERFMQDIADRKSPRLMICVPPRHGKSKLASEMFPAWALGHHPTWEVIGAAHSMTLTEGFSRRMRDTMNTTEYQALFTETKLRTDSQSVQSWTLTKGGGYVAAGVGTGITGKGAHLLIIDDPVKDAEAAHSEQIRQNTLDWYMTTARSRLAPGGGVMLIMTRWHDMDLAGKLLQLQKELREFGTPEEEIEQWDLINYPAIAEEDEFRLPTGEIIHDNRVAHETPGSRLLRNKGDPLHEQRYPLKALKVIKSGYDRTNPQHWHALYQQKPVPDDGSYFQTSMFRYTDTAIDHSEMRIISAWDVAVTQKQTSDWTVGVVAGIDFDDRIHIIEIIRDRFQSLETIEAILEIQQRYKPYEIGVESGVILHAVKPMLVKEMLRRRIYINLNETLKPVTDKAARAKPLQGALSLGRIMWPRNAPWREKLEHEMLRFPSGEHDDIVDAMAWMVRMSANVPAPTKQKRKPTPSWRDKFLTEGSKNWKTA